MLVVEIGFHFWNCDQPQSFTISEKAQKEELILETRIWTVRKNRGMRCIIHISDSTDPVWLADLAGCILQ